MFDNSSFLIYLHIEFSHYASQELHESMKVNMSIIEITMKLVNNFKIDALKKNIKIKQLELILNEPFNNLF